MNIYVFNIIILLILSLIDIYCISQKEVLINGSNKRQKIKVFTIFTMFIVLTVEMGLRGDFQTDTLNYYYIFLADGYDLFVDKGEYVFALLMFLSKLISPDYVVFLLITAILMAFFYTKFVAKESNIAWLSFLILFASGSFYTGFNIMRQVFAAAFFSLSYKYIYKQKFFNYLICILIATCVHYSALLLLPAYFLPKIKWRRLKTELIVFLIAIIGVAVYLFSDVMLNIALNYFSDYSADGAYGIDWGNTLSSVLKSVLMVLFVILNRKYFDLKNERDAFIFNGCVVYLLFAIGGYNVFLIQRFTHYFIPCLMISYPMIVSRMETKQKQINSLFLLFMMFVLLHINVILSGDYYFFWDNVYFSFIN